MRKFKDLKFSRTGFGTIETDPIYWWLTQFVPEFIMSPSLKRKRDSTKSTHYTTVSRPKKARTISYDEVRWL